MFYSFFSSIGVKMSLDEQLPIANWPTESSEYKVVQLQLDGNLHLRFAEEGWETHAVILMKLFSDRDIKYDKIVSRSECDVPALQGERYKIHGMGKSRVNVEQRQASFYGNSFDYGIGIDTKHLDSVRSLINDWKLE